MLPMLQLQALLMTLQIMSYIEY